MLNKYKKFFIIFIIILNSCAAVNIGLPIQMATTTGRNEETLFSIGGLIAGGLLGAGISFIMNDSSTIIIEKKTVELNLNDKLELKIIVTNKKSGKLLKLESKNTDIVEVVSEKGAVILAKK